MNWARLKAEALEAGERKRLHRWSMDETDMPEPMGAVHIVLSGEAATQAVEAGEAAALPDGRAQLNADWENDGAISYARASSQGVREVLVAHKIACQLVEVLND